MKKYESKQMVASSRYQNYFPTLPAEIQQDVYKRINELLTEEKEMAHGDGGICNPKRDSVRYHDSGGEMI